MVEAWILAIFCILVGVPIAVQEKHQNKETGVYLLKSKKQKLQKIFDTVVDRTFKQLTEDNPIPDFMCHNEHKKAINYALALYRKGLLEKTINKAMKGKGYVYRMQ